MAVNKRVASVVDFQMAGNKGGQHGDGGGGVTVELISSVCVHDSLIGYWRY